MPFADAADYRFNPFDLTKVWPHAEGYNGDIGAFTQYYGSDELMRVC
jgi:catalase